MNRKMDIVITMGGLGMRFRKAGYTVPKYQIMAKGKTLFEWSMISLAGFADIADSYIFIVMQDENTDVEAFIKENCEKLGIRNYRIIVIDHLTDGQATTAMLAKKYWHPDHALMIYNIDTYVEAGAMNASQLKGDGFIPCFHGEGDHWSFVRTNAAGRAVEIKEKVRISDNCTVGAYYFRTCRLYEELYEEFYSDPAVLETIVNHEKYIAPLYDYLLKKNGEIYISDIRPGQVHVLGTPEELQAFLNE